MQNHNNVTKKTSNTVLKKYTSNFIWKGCVWEGVGDRTELQHIDPPRHAYGHQRFFPVLLGCSNGGLGSSISGCWFSLRHLISNSSETQLIWSPTATAQSGTEGLLCWVLSFSTSFCLQLVLSPKWLNFLCTALYNSSTLSFFLWTSKSHS